MTAVIATPELYTKGGNLWYYPWLVISWILTIGSILLAVIGIGLIIFADDYTTAIASTVVYALLTTFFLFYVLRLSRFGVDDDKWQVVSVVDRRWQIWEPGSVHFLFWPIMKASKSDRVDIRDIKINVFRTETIAELKDKRKRVALSGGFLMVRVKATKTDVLRLLYSVAGHGRLRGHKVITEEVVPAIFEEAVEAHMKTLELEEATGLRGADISSIVIPLIQPRLDARGLEIINCTLGKVDEGSATRDVGDTVMQMDELLTLLGEQTLELSGLGSKYTTVADLKYGSADSEEREDYEHFREMLKEVQEDMIQQGFVKAVSTTSGSAGFGLLGIREVMAATRRSSG